LGSLGCTVPVRAMNYELSARRTAERLGIEFVDIDGFTCCGYPARLGIALVVPHYLPEVSWDGSHRYDVWQREQRC